MTTRTTTTPEFLRSALRVALTALGYSDKEALAAVKKLPEGLGVGEAIRQSLRMLAKA